MAARDLDPDTRNILKMLRFAINVLGYTYREIANKVGVSSSELKKMLSGAGEMRLDDVIRVCKAMDIEPSDFFRIAYPTLPLFTSPTALTLHFRLDIPLPNPMKDMTVDVLWYRARSIDPIG